MLGVRPELSHAPPPAGYTLDEVFAKLGEEEPEMAVAMEGYTVTKITELDGAWGPVRTAQERLLQAAFTRAVFTKQALFGWFSVGAGQLSL